MTSISNQQQKLAQNSSTAAQSVAPVPAPSSSSGTSSQQAAAGRGFGSTNKRQGTFPNSTTPAHGRSDSISTASGKGSIQPAVPNFGGGPTIVNGNNAVSPTSLQHEHSRKSSVTISATGTSGQMPNGGPVAGNKPPLGNGLPVQFGSINSMAGASSNLGDSAPQIPPNPSSLAVSSPSDPRVTSPATSPSPIPQPSASSGGRPPSSFHSQGNGLSFGGFGGEDTAVSS